MLSLLIAHDYDERSNRVLSYNFFPRKAWHTFFVDFFSSVFFSWNLEFALFLAEYYIYYT